MKRKIKITADRNNQMNRQREHEREHSHDENNRQILREQADCIPIEKPTRGHFVINQMTSMREKM